MITAKLLVEAITEQENCSLYQVSKMLTVSRQSVYGWRAGSHKMSTEKATEAAELLGWNKKVVLAWLLLENNLGTDLEPELRAMAENLQRELAPDLGAEFQQELPLAS